MCTNTTHSQNGVMRAGRHAGVPDSQCHRENSILYVLLMFGTLWLAVFLYNFRKT